MSSYLSIAPYYDTLFPSPSGLIEWILGQNPKKVLDLGCGTGLLVQALQESAIMSEGIDPDPEMIQKGLERSAGLPLSTLSIHELPSESFDLVTCVGNVCSYWDRDAWQVQLQEIHRILKPQGRCIFQSVGWDTMIGKKSCSFLPRLVDDFTLERSYLFEEDMAHFELKLSHKGKLLAEQNHTLFPKTHAEIHALCSQKFTALGSWGNWNFEPWQASSPASISLWSKS